MTEYVIQLNFITDVPYYVQIGNKEWKELYNPHNATRFHTKLAADTWIRNYCTFSKYCTVLPFDEVVKEFDEWAKEGMIRREFDYPDATYDLPYDPEIHTVEDVLNWHINADVDSLRTENVETWPDLFSIFECLHSVDHYLPSDSDDEEVVTVSMSVKPTTKLSTFRKELNLVKDKITLTHDNGDKIINIFDHYLSEGGNTVYFHIGKRSYSIVDRWNQSLYKGSLKNVFNWWKEYRYYR